RIVSELLPGPSHLDQRRSGVNLAYDARQSQAFGRVTFTLFGFAHWLAPPLECRSNPWRKLQFPGWAEIIRKWSVEKRRIPYRAALFKDCEAGAVMAVLANGGVRVVGAAARWWAPYRLRALVAPRWLRM